MLISFSLSRNPWRLSLRTLNRPRNDLDLGKTFVMKRSCLRMFFWRTKNGCFFCNSVNSWMTMESCGMTDFFVRYSVKMTYMKRMT
jgi:hypothetical protein